MSDPQSLGTLAKKALRILGALLARVMRRFSSAECRSTVGRPQVEVIPSRVAAFTGHSAASLDTTNRCAEIARFASPVSNPRVESKEVKGVH